MKYQGLKDSEVLELRKEFGENILSEKEGTPVFFIFLAQFKNPLPSQTPSQLEVNSTNCSQFAAVPSSQYCSMVPANVKVLCEQCKSAGF